MKNANTKHYFQILGELEAEEIEWRTERRKTNDEYKRQQYQKMEQVTRRQIEAMRASKR